MKSSTDKMIEYFANSQLTPELREELEYLFSRKSYSANQTLRFGQIMVEVSQNSNSRPRTEVFMK